MKIVKLTGHLSVSAQISPEDVAEIAAQGFDVLVNNRPDGEEGSQPAGQAIAEAAARAGLEYHYLPVTHTTFPGPDFGAMSDLLADKDRRTLAFCRSGTRCANLWVASVDQPEREDARRVASGQGFDLGMSANYLARS